MRFQNTQESRQESTYIDASAVANVRSGCYNAALDLTFFFGEGAWHNKHKARVEYA